jgi:hypothetical protein
MTDSSCQKKKLIKKTLKKIYENEIKEGFHCLKD